MAEVVVTAINEDRGEVGLELGGRVFPMLPTYAAANAIESQIGGIVALVKRAMNPNELISMREMAVIAFETIRAAGRDRSDPMLASIGIDKLAQMIYSEGLIKVSPTFVKILTNVVVGGADPAKKKTESPELQQPPTAG